MAYLASFSGLLQHGSNRMGSVLADVEFRLKKHAMDRFTTTAGRNIQIVLEAEFRELTGVKRDVRRKTPSLPHQVSLSQRGEKRHSGRSPGAVSVVHPKAGHPTVDEPIRQLAVQAIILEAGGRKGIDRIPPRPVVPQQILRVPGHKRETLGGIDRL